MRLRPLALSLLIVPVLSMAEPLPPLNLWPGPAPDEPTGFQMEPEDDKTSEKDNLVAGKRLIRLTNVATPQLTVYPAPAEKSTGASVIVCPGGGHSVLAYDLEGSEICEWLNGLGVTGILLKYRVPRRDPAMPWKHAVQDAQRAVTLTRAHAAEWKLDPLKIGIIGFSAGGQTAGLTALTGNAKTYAPVDALDAAPSRPDFAMLIYPAYFANKEETALQPEVIVPADAPPVLFIHASNDPVTPMSSVLLYSELKRKKVPAELHIFPTGGHGYGARPTDLAITRWPALAETWMRGLGILGVH